MSEVNFDDPGVADRPSPSIWKSNRKTLINDLGLGDFMHEDFLGMVADTVAAGEQRPAFGDLSLDCDDDTVITRTAGRAHGVIDLETDGDDNDAWALFSQPFAKFTLHSGQKVWMEGRIELGDVAMDGGLFLGFAEEALLTRDIVADAAGAIGTGDYVGFKVVAANPDAVDAVYRLQANAEVVVATDVTNSTSLPAAERASLVNDTPVKFGLFFDGGDRLSFFVKGRKITSIVLSNSLFPTNLLMGAIFGLKTGAIAAESAGSDWIRASYQERN